MHWLRKTDGQRLTSIWQILVLSFARRQNAPIDYFFYPKRQKWNILWGHFSCFFFTTSKRMLLSRVRLTFLLFVFVGRQWQIEGSLGKNKTLQVLKRVQMWGSTADLTWWIPQRCFHQKGLLSSTQTWTKSQSEWIVVPCALQAPVTTKPLIISWQKPKGIILLSSVLHC